MYDIYVSHIEKRGKTKKTPMYLASSLKYKVSTSEARFLVVTPGVPASCSTKVSLKNMRAV